jgi:nucleotide-binding universal stress UspA family protein
MGFEKLLHVTNSQEASLTDIQHFAGLRKLGLEEVIFSQPQNSDAWKTRLGDVGLQAKILEMDGPMVRSILDAAGREGVSFISTDMEAETGGMFRRLFSKELLKLSRVPVMLMPKTAATHAGEQAGMFDHVIFATDWSGSCREVMRYLLKFKGIIKELEIIHVVEKRLSVKEMRELRYMLSAWRSAFLDGGIDAESHIYAGKRHEEILLAAKDYGGTCIVMGGSGKSSVKSILRRSCSYRVAQGSPVPTIVVP